MDGIGDDTWDLLMQLPTLASWAKRRVAAKKEPRPFIIEIAGMPKAGKSSTIGDLRHFISHGPKILAAKRPDLVDGMPNKYRVYTPAEGVSKRTPQLLGDNLLEYNTWAGAYALQELLRANHDDFYSVVILDRGPWDAGCWLEYVRDHKPDDLDVPENINEIITFFQLAEWTVKSDLHIVLVVDPETAHKRERSQRMITHTGPASKPELMQAMYKIYHDHFQRLQEGQAKHCDTGGRDSCLLIDTTKLTAREVVQRVLQQVFLVAAGSHSAQEVKARPPRHLPATVESRVTMASIRKILAPVLVNLKSTRKKEILEMLPLLAREGASLEVDEAEAFHSHLRKLVPDEPLLLNSVSVGVLAESLRDALKHSKKR